MIAAAKATSRYLSRICKEISEYNTRKVPEK
jgi:hypothetical protein